MKKRCVVGVIDVNKFGSRGYDYVIMSDYARTLCRLTCVEIHVYIKIKVT